MTVENNLTHGLKTSLLGSAYKTEYDENLLLLDKNRVTVGTFANRPVAGTAERFYYASDTGNLYYDNGASWLPVAATSATAHASTHASAGSDAVLLDQTQVIGLATALTGKANSAHAHSESDVTNLVANLASKSATTHTHSGVYEPANVNIQPHISNITNPHAVTKAQVGLSNVQDTKLNLTATIAPTATDDSALGYSVGSLWIDVTADKSYTCVDSTATSAIWNEVGSTIPAFRATIGTNQSIANNTTTTIMFNTISAKGFNTGDFNVSTYRFTPTTAGKFFVHMGVPFNSTPSAPVIQTGVRKNGATELINDDTGTYSAGRSQSQAVFGIIGMNGTTDYLDAFIYQNSGSASPLGVNDGIAIFEAFRIGGV